MIKMESVSRRKEIFVFSQYNFMILMAGFFISRVHILNKLTPFGIAYLSGCLLTGNWSLFIPLSTGLGLYSFHGSNSLSYLIIGVSIYLVFNRNREKYKNDVIKGSLMASGVFLLIKGLWNILGPNNQYNLLILFLETSIIFTMTYVFSFSFPLQKNILKKVKKEGLICSFICMALILSGFNDIAIYGLSLKNIISMVAIIYLANKQGVLYGVIGSAVIGLISYISHIEMPFIISLLVVGGLLAGLFREIGRAGSVLGFLLGNGIVSFYINRFATSFFDYRELLFSSIIFLALSQFIKFDLKDLIDKDEINEASYELDKEDYILDKLDKTSELFLSLSKILREEIDDDIGSSFDVYNTVDEISNRACKKCRNYLACWKDNYYETYQGVFNLMGTLESGTLDREHIIGKVQSFCKQPKLLAFQGIQSYELLKERQACNKRLWEQRKLLSDQMMNFTKMISDVKMDIKRKPIFHKDIRDELIRELEINRIEVIELRVVEIEDKKFEILMEIRNSSKSERNIIDIKNIVSRILGMDFSLDYSMANINKDSISFKLTKTNRFNTFTGIAYESNSESQVSGDNYTFGEIGNLCFMAISDGMGIGRKARDKSSVAIELIEKLMEINMDKNTIIKTINSIIRNKSKEEVFTTLDLGFIDLYTGTLQIMKNGSPPTFIKRKDEVRLINSKSLPIGILENVDFHIYEEGLEDGDIIIMMSDGILESNRLVENQELWLQDYISRINSQNPQVIVNEILRLAKLANEGRERDDMTIVATKIWRNY